MTPSPSAQDDGFKPDDGFKADDEEKPGKPPYRSDLRKIPLVGGALGALDENFVSPGIERMAQGVERIAGKRPQGETRGSQIAGGVSDVARGAIQGMGVPFIAQSAVAAPVRTALGLGVGSAVGSGTEHLAQGAGVQPGYAELAGTGAGVAAGVGASRLPGLDPAGVKAASTQGVQQGVGQIPIVGKMAKAYWDAVKPQAPQAPEPFRPNPRIQARLRYGGPASDAGPATTPGTTIPRRGWAGPPSDESEGETIARQMGKAIYDAITVPKGSVVVPPAEGVPGRYGEVGSQFGERMANAAFAKDQAIAQYLRAQRVTPEQFDQATAAQLSAWAKAANPKYKGVNPERVGDLRNLLFPSGGATGQY